MYLRVYHRPRFEREDLIFKVVFFLTLKPLPLEREVSRPKNATVL